jgi:hypothetical protein
MPLGEGTDRRLFWPMSPAAASQVTGSREASAVFYFFGIFFNKNLVYDLIKALNYSDKNQGNGGGMGGCHWGAWPK